MKAIFGGVIAIVLLGIYIHLIRVGYLVIDCVSAYACTKYAASYFNEGMAQALSIVGGLVSALVIAELAVTKPGEPPAARSLAANASAKSKRILTLVTVCYISVWIMAGLVAFFIGLYHPKVLPPITDLGQAWLGLAVASAYAYFEIKPS